MRFLGGSLTFTNGGVREPDIHGGGWKVPGWESDLHGR